MNKTRRMGIFGGTFDPIHHGHLIIVEDIREKFDLDKIVFIPTGNPPHKSTLEITNAEHRFNMVSEAVRGNPHFECSRIELERAGTIYTVDTLEQFRENEGIKTRLFFIAGADIAWDILKWKEPEKVFSLCELIITYRPEYIKQDFIEQVNYLREHYQAKIELADSPMVEISSTMLRKKVKDGKSIKYLVPECVEAYIANNNLFKE